MTSTNRVQSDRGWCNPAELPKGPNGRNLCRRCARECDKANRTFCSAECVHQWKLRTQPAYLRHKVLERDLGVCALCGVDTMAEIKANNPRWAMRSSTGHLWHADHIIPVIEGGGECGIENIRTLCVACHRSETAALRRRMADKRKANS